MKRILSLLLLCVFLFSCSKETSLEGSGSPGTGGGGTGGGTGGGSGTGTYYIKGKMDGILKTYTNTPMAMFTTMAGTSVVSLFAGAGGTSLEGLAFSINFSTGTLTAGTTYSETGGGMDYLLAGVYNPNSTTITYAAGLTAASADPLRITITSKTATEVTGTFQGAFYKQDLINPTMIYTENKRFTEGEFKLPVR